MVYYIGIYVDSYVLEIREDVPIVIGLRYIGLRYIKISSFT